MAEDAGSEAPGSQCRNSFGAGIFAARGFSAVSNVDGSRNLRDCGWLPHGVYAGWSRGFRSGGFNQTGVGEVARQNGVLGVNDTFQAEIADTYEVGVKSQFLDRRLTVDADVFHTQSRNGYFFVYIAADSTQNLGNLNATYKGAELAVTARPTDRLDVYASFGYTDSRITAMADPTWGILSLLALTVGLPYFLLSTNKIYNAEFSPGNVGGAGFLWRALPRRYGVDLDYRF